MTRLSLSVFCVLIWPAVANAADDLAPFRFFKDVSRDASEEEELLGLTLDSDIYAAARDGLPDIRIVDGQDVDSPFILEVVAESRSKTVREYGRCQVVALRKTENDGVEIIARLDQKNGVAESLRLVTPLSNYERHVQVFGSRDGRKWSRLVSDAFVFDYSDIIDVRNNEIRLPRNDFRQFKFVIDHITDDRNSPMREITQKFRDGQLVEKWEKRKAKRRPFRIDRIEYSHDVVKEKRRGHKKADYPVLEFKTEEDTQAKQTIILVRMRREPLTGLSLKTMSHNFNRRVVVQVPLKPPGAPNAIRKETAEQDTVQKWNDVADAVISDVSFRDFHREQLEITFPEQRVQTYRIIIHNEDNPPLKITAVEARGNVKRVVFRASQGTAYRLFYGSETAQRPGYETEPLREMMDRGFQLVDGSLGGQNANPIYGEDRAPLTLRNLLNNKIFLGCAIALMVIVLAWVLFRAGRRINEIPPA